MCSLVAMLLFKWYIDIVVVIYVYFAVSFVVSSPFEMVELWD